LSRTVFFFGAALVVINLIFGLMGEAPGSAGMPIAWQAHLAGFFVGLLLIGPWAALFGKRSIAQANQLPPLVPTPEEQMEAPLPPEPQAPVLDIMEDAPPAADGDQPGKI
jgi:hypothetical protein